MARPDRPDVFAYLDYRAFLRDHYSWGKTYRNLSHRGLSRRAGIKSPSFLKRVMDGTRNLSDETAPRVGSACGLDSDALQYFSDLVRFNQAKKADVRRAAFEKIRGFERYQRVQNLGAARDDYHAHWYLPVIRELASSPYFNDDPAWIAKTVRPRIKVSQAKAALRTLEKLNLLSRDEDGRLVQTDAIVDTGPETASVHIGAFHHEMIKRAAASIDELPSEQRNISSITYCVDKGGLDRLISRIQAFQRELLVDDLITEGTPRQVVQVNFQVFPLSSAIEDPS